MTVSVRMDPLLEKELELAAKRWGVTKSQFVIDAVERSLGRKNPYLLMQTLIAEEEACAYEPLPRGSRRRELPYDTDASKLALLTQLRAKHGVGRTR